MFVCVHVTGSSDYLASMCNYSLVLHIYLK